jgi:hypothetical protein
LSGAARFHLPVDYKADTLPVTITGHWESVA